MIQFYLELSSTNINLEIFNLMSKNFFLIVYYTLDNFQIQVTSVDTDFQLTIFGIQKNRRELNVKQEN